MKILLNNLLNLTEEQIENSKIELNMTAGKASDGAESFIERWMKTSVENKESGKTECSFWGWYGTQRNFYPGQWVFSFVRMGSDEWMMVSAAEIIDVPKNSRANVKILNQYKAYFGRLIIKYKKGNTHSRYVFRLKKFCQPFLLALIFQGTTMLVCLMGNLKQLLMEIILLITMRCEIKKQYMCKPIRRRGNYMWGLRLQNTVCCWLDGRHIFTTDMVGIKT